MKRQLYVAFAMVFGLALLTGCGTDQGSSSSLLGPVSGDQQETGRTANSASSAATVQSATLHLFEASNNDQTINVYRITSDWDEMTVTWNNFGSSYAGPVIGSFVAGSYGDKQIDVTSAVQAWMDGTYPNYGLLLDQDPFNTPRAAWYSREVADREPFLVVCYEENGVVTCDTTVATADSYIYETGPDQNHGLAHELYTGWESENDLEKQVLLRFSPTPPPPPPPPPGDGCTHTIGYWKTHAGFGPQADVVTELLPISLGTAGGDKSLDVTTAAMAVDVLKMKTYGSNSNGITKLYAQMLGAKLSMADGADGGDIADALAAADAFLADHDWTDWSSLSKAQKNMVLGWQSMFDDYNNGLIGPDHCD